MSPSFTKKGPGRKHKQGVQTSFTNKKVSSRALRAYRKLCSAFRQVPSFLPRR